MTKETYKSKKDFKRIFKCMTCGTRFDTSVHRECPSCKPGKK